jgi:hypothetical protein
LKLELPSDRVNVLSFLPVKVRRGNLTTCNRQGQCKVLAYRGLTLSIVQGLQLLVIAIETSTVLVWSLDKRLKVVP